MPIQTRKVSKRNSTGIILGRIFEAELKRRGISIRSAAKQTGITPGGLAFWFGGKVTSPDYDNVRALCALLDWSIGDVDQRLPKVELGEPSRTTSGRPPSAQE